MTSMLYEDTLPGREHWTYRVGDREALGVTGDGDTVIRMDRVDGLATAFAAGDEEKFAPDELTSVDRLAVIADRLDERHARRDMEDHGDE